MKGLFLLLCRWSSASFAIPIFAFVVSYEATTAEIESKTNCVKSLLPVYRRPYGGILNSLVILYFKSGYRRRQKNILAMEFPFYLPFIDHYFLSDPVAACFKISNFFFEISLCHEMLLYLIKSKLFMPVTVPYIVSAASTVPVILG